VIQADPAPVVQVAPAQAQAGAVGGTVPPAPRHFTHAPGDPLEKFNRRMFAIHMSLDKAILRPAAMGYKHVLPKFLRSGLRHFFSNLTEPIVFANFVLQLKPKSAMRTVVRFWVNSTVGLAGAIDVAAAKRINLPYKPNGFGDTLGFYGVKPGPYLFLPLYGPSDFRDFAGGQIDSLMLRVAFDQPYSRTDYRIVSIVITGLDRRAEYDSDLKSLLSGALDPYATLRSVYQQDRAGEIAGLKGKSADLDMPDDFTDPAAVAPADAAAPAGASPEAAPIISDQPPPPEIPATSEPQAPRLDDQAGVANLMKLPWPIAPSTNIALATGSTNAASSSR